MNEYQKIFEVKLSINDLFVNTTLALHSALIQASTKSAFVEIPALAAQTSYAISDAQRRLWVLSQFDQGSAVYNMPGSIYLNQPIELEHFKKAIESTINRHEILRTVFKADPQAKSDNGFYLIKN